MRHYTEILIWENKRRLDSLKQFRSLVIRYFNNSRVGFGGRRIEGDAAREAKSKINLLSEEIHSIMLSAEIDPIFSWTPPTAVGGQAIEIDLIENIFELDQFDIGPSNPLAVIDRAIEKYDSNRKAVLVRTYSPFFYLAWTLDALSDLPFIVIGILGFNRQKIKASAIGMLVKGVLYLIMVVVPFFMILHFAGVLETIRSLVHELLEIGSPLNL